MAQNPTIKQILSSACAPLNQHLAEIEESKDFGRLGKYSKLRSKSNTGKEKQWLLENLMAWCIEKGYDLKTEYRFHPARKFRFDYAIEEIMTGIEYEGLMSKKSRHTTIGGYTKDTDKYNAATALGWKVLRVTALNYKSIIQLLK